MFFIEHIMNIMVGVMDQRVNMVTLGVSNVPRARAFYEDGLGWRASPQSSSDFTIFRAGEMLVGLFPRGELAAETALDDTAPPDAFGGMTLSYAVATREEAIIVMAKAEAAGALVTTRPVKTSWGGFAGYFTDPDGHAWEIVWNPHWFDTDGQLLIS